MNSSYLTTFSKALLTGVFAGISATFVCIIYNVIFRDETGYQLFNLINVSSLIFGVNIAFMFIGVIYYWFIKYLKRGEMIYIGVFVLITIFGIIKTSGIQRTDDLTANIQFHHLFIAMIVIWSIAASIGIPVMFHSKRFEEHVL
jgi:4-amino-4-deoxy-L-arabinose transferase-like glycosyltransferase